MANSIAVVIVFLGCSLNVVFLELLIREDPGSGNIITFFQFLLIALEGLIFTTHFLKKKPVVPLSYYVKMVAMFFVVSVTNNYAMKFNISMPLQMIFKSGSLMANMVMGILILKKKYTISKYGGVILISVGIAVCTFASSQNINTGSANDDWNFSYWLIGVLLLTFALFLSAHLGITQEILYEKFGKHPKEALFYSHALPLPGFILLASDIYNHANIFSQSEIITIPFVGAAPKLWIFLLCNILTQYACIRSVFVLTTEYSSLTVTLIITLRKFTSLLFSIFYFNNAFTLMHWLGTMMVFVGTLIFIDIFNIFKTLTGSGIEKKNY